MTQPYFLHRTQYYYWRAVASSYQEKATEPGMPLVLRQHYERQRLASLRHAACYRGLMLESEGVTRGENS